jgi:hypothetical protein
MMLNCMGDAHSYTLGAIYDCYCVINAQRRFPATAQLAQFRHVLPQIRETGQYMMLRKLVMVTVLGLRDILGSLPQT